MQIYNAHLSTACEVACKYATRTCQQHASRRTIMRRTCTCQQHASYASLQTKISTAAATVAEATATGFEKAGEVAKSGAGVVTEAAQKAVAAAK